MANLARRFRVRAAVVVELDAERVEVPLMRDAHVVDDLDFGAAFFARADHDRRAVRVIGADVNHAAPGHFLVPHEDVGHRVLEYVTDVQVAVGVG